MTRLSVLLATLALSALTIPANANLVSNGSFETVTASTTGSFTSAGVANWNNASLGQLLVEPSWYTNGYLVYDFANSQFVGLAPGFPQSSPDGGNFVISDGDDLNSPITQTIGGLNPGDVYQLGFYQALSQDTEPGITIPGQVTGYWQVAFGTSTQNSPGMSANGTIPTFANWSQQTMNFTATSTSEVLSFLSVGTGEPPMVMLDGVSLVDTTPEPATWLAMVLGGSLIGWKIAGRVRTR